MSTYVLLFHKHCSTIQRWVNIESASYPCNFSCSLQNSVMIEVAIIIVNIWYWNLPAKYSWQDFGIFGLSDVGFEIQCCPTSFTQKILAKGAKLV